MKIDIINWESGQPWPDKIKIDGLYVEYANKWFTTAGKQVIVYTEPGKITEHWVNRKKFKKEN